MLGFIFTAKAAAVFMTGSGTTLNTAYEDSPTVLGKRTKDGRNVKKAHMHANQVLFVPFVRIHGWSFKKLRG